MNFPTHIDQVIHDHQSVLYTEARAHRLARSARAKRSRGRAIRRQENRPDAADVLMRLGREVDRLQSTTLDRRTERAVADLVVQAAAALEAPARSVGLAPLAEGSSPIVAQRWLARLAERTSDQSLDLDADQTVVLAGIVDELHSLSARSTAIVASPVAVAAPKRSRRVVSADLRGAC